MKRVISLIVALLLLGYIVFYIITMDNSRQDVVCQQVNIIIKDSADRQYLDEQDLIKLLKKKSLYPVNKPLNEINADSIKRVLMQNDLLSTINVFKTPSGNIKIEVTQKMPILRVFSKKGNYYIDDKADIMTVNLRQATYLPIASGNIEKDFAVNELYKFALFLQKHDFWNNQIEQIYVNSDGAVELIPRVGNSRIILGTLEDFQEKMDKLMLFYEQAIPKIGWDKYSIINLRYKNQIVCTKK